MPSIAHIVHPVVVPPESDLFLAQPVTLASMLKASDFAPDAVDVTLFAVKYHDENPAIPDGFTLLADLDRSVADLHEFAERRKLAVMNDILERLYQATDADHLIYTNIDISLQPHFYAAVSQFIDDGNDGFVITRRTISKDYASADELPRMYAELGDRHPGHDCFVFGRELYPKFELANVCLGTRAADSPLFLNIACHSQRFKVFGDKHLTFHLGDDRVWDGSRYADYVQFNMHQTTQVMARLQEQFGPLEQLPVTRQYVEQLLRSGAMEQARAATQQPPPGTQSQSRASPRTSPGARPGARPGAGAGAVQSVMRRLGDWIRGA